MIKGIGLLLKSKYTSEKKKFQNIESLLNLLKKENIYPIFCNFKSAGTEPIVKGNKTSYLMFSSNNYLGLAKHKNIVKGIEEQAKIHGGGPGGSRFLCGNIEILDELDKKIAEVIGCEDAITFPTGYMANLAVFSAVMDPFFVDGLPYKKGSGVIFSDELNHATIVDGCRLSSAKKEIFKHNDVADLENKLKKYPLSKHKMIVTEGVFSLDGHLGALKEISELAKKYNCILMVDDAHGIGVMGPRGGGVPQELGVVQDIDIFMGSFDKTLGCMGGYLAGKKELIDYFRVACRPYIFSSAVPAIMAGGAIESLNIVSGKEGSELREKLAQNSKYLRKKLEDLGFEVLGDGSISVLPVMIGDDNLAIKFSKRLLEENMFLPCFRYPAVPQNKSRARVTVMATHKKEELDQLAVVFEKLGKEFGIIG